MTETDDKNKEHDPMDDTRMSLGDHLMELRSRLIKSIWGMIVGFGLCIFFGKEILGFITAPAIAALQANGYVPQLTVLSPPEDFMTFIKVSLIAGIFVVSPWIFHQIWGFVAAGLYEHEKRFVNTFVPFSAILFVLGGLFFVTIVAPVSFNFFIRFSSNWHPSSFADNFFYNRLLGVDEDDKGKDNPQKTNLQTDQPHADDLANVLHPKKVDDVCFLRQKYLPGASLNVPGAHAIDSIINMPFSAQIKRKNFNNIDDVTDEDEAAPFVSHNYRLKEYVSFVLMLALAFGLAFQMPLAVFFLGRLGLVAITTYIPTHSVG